MSLNRRILKWIGVAFVAGILLCGVLVGALSIALNRVPEYRMQAQAWIDQHTGLDIEFASLHARWRWYGPELVFDDAIVRTADRKRTLAVARRGGLGFDLWTAISTARLKAGRLFLQGTELHVIRTREGRIEFVGQDALPDFNPDEPFNADALPTGRLHVRDARVSFRDLKTGRGPWIFQGVEFDLQRRSSTMKLTGSAALPKSLGKHLRFSATSDGRLADPQTLTWTFTVEGRDVDLAGWADVMPNHWLAPETGSGSLMVAGKFRGLNLEYASGEVKLSQVTLATPVWSTPLPRPGVLQNPDALAHETSTEPTTVAAVAPAPTNPTEFVGYTRLGAKFRVQHSQQGWHTEVTDLELARTQSPWTPSRLELDFARNEAGGYDAKGKLSLLVIENIWPLLAYAPESERMALLRALHASGRLRDVSWQVSRATPEETLRYSFNAQLEGASFAAVDKTPGVTGIHAAVSATEREGTIKLDSHDVTLLIPRLFRTPLPADVIKGAVTWTRTDDGIQIAAPELQVANSDGHVLANMTLTIPQQGVPMIDLRAHAEDLHAVAAPRYMPAGIMQSKVLEWLDRAFPTGHVAAADLTLQGNLHAFPFRHGQGLFLIKAKIDGLTIDYQPGWLPATDVVVDAEFRNEGLTVRASSARVNGLRLENAWARFKDFKDSELEIKAGVSGDLGQGLGYVQQTPIGPVLGDIFQNLQGNGALQAEVDLLLPLKDLTHRKVSVRTQLKDAQASLKGLEQRATEINGQLNVRNTAVRDVNLTGEWLGGGVKVGSDDSTSGTIITVRGNFSASEVARALKFPVAFEVAGSADWSGVVYFPGGEHNDKVPLFSADSDLVGVGIHMPAPFDKQTSVARPLHVEMTHPSDAALLRVSLGDARALVRLANARQGWGLDRGTIRLDGTSASLPDHPGLRVEGTIDHLVLDDWLHLNTDAPGTRGTNERQLSSILRSASLRIGTFSLFGYSWSDVRGLLQAKDKAWRVDVSGPEASGQVTVPYRLDGSQPIALDMERLVLRANASNAGDAANKSTDPRDLPPLRVRIGDLTFSDRHLGSVELQADRQANGLQFPTFTARTASFSAEGSGEWVATPSGQQSKVLVDFESSDLRQAVHDLNYGDFIAAKRATLHLDLTSPGGIDEQFLAHASGKISLQIDDGQLLSVQPGAGRVLGLFSISDLKRRLSLDFSDITDQGLSFDTMHGDFDVNDGNAYTHNFLLRGPAAEIGIAGRTGLGTRDYDETAVVTGNLGATLPVAGVLAGGPVVGAALLVFSQIFKEPLKGVTRGYYRITGHWDNPTVERVEASEVKQATTRTAQEAEGSKPETEPKKDGQ